MRSGAAVVACLVVAGCGAGRESIAATTAAQIPPPVAGVTATVISVSDGDSFKASVDGQEIEVRLLGINAPERDECLGAESTAWLTATIEGKEIDLVPEAELDQFDRVLARAVVGDIYINLAAVAAGHALIVSASEVDRDALIEAEDAARLAGLGIWGDEICGASGPKASLEIVDVEYSHPGPADFETVTIENTGDDSINLSGFTLRDESSINRYALPAELLQSGESHLVFVSSCEPLPPIGPAWCSDEPVWNNDGDTALLLDRFGRIVAFLRY